MTVDEEFPLKRVPVILMIFFDIITMGIYSCCWFLQRWDKFNELSRHKKLSVVPFVICLVLTGIGIMIAIASGVLEGVGEELQDQTFLQGAKMIEGSSKVLEFAVGITLLVQSFKIKSMLEEYIKRRDRFGLSLSGAGTFFFHNYYLQYRINKIYKAEESPVRQAISDVAIAGSDPA